jgi:hypothetical protein
MELAYNYLGMMCSSSSSVLLNILVRKKGLILASQDYSDKTTPYYVDHNFLTLNFNNKMRN